MRIWMNNDKKVYNLLIYLYEIMDFFNNMVKG